MPKREIIEWFTTKTGLHIPIYNGQTKEEALQFVIDKAKNSKLVKPTNIKSGKIGKSVIDSLSKEKQIQKAKEEANRLNEEEQRKHLPKELSLPDIDADEVLKYVDHVYYNKKHEKDYNIIPGTKITNVYVFAGPGCRKPFNKAKEYEARYPEYGWKAEEISHCSGKAWITNGKKKEFREIHWFQGKDKKLRRPRVKWKEKS